MAVHRCSVTGFVRKGHKRGFLMPVAKSPLFSMAAFCHFADRANAIRFAVLRARRRIDPLPQKR
ncbi:MAG: hypothetical protein B7Y47_05235 [Sphingomonas sp. 28-63-12]|nr:MAG: hypothetical protein B7Y47_05235 [Sphingomonas sp. 28-63-12]